MPLKFAAVWTTDDEIPETVDISEFIVARVFMFVELALTALMLAELLLTLVRVEEIPFKFVI